MFAPTPRPSAATFFQTVMSLMVCAMPKFGNFKSSRPFVTAKIFDLPIRMLYDTGASISCIDEKEYRKIPIDQRPTKLEQLNTENVKSATGDMLQVKGVFKMPIFILNRKVWHNFYVVKNLNETAILGSDFIHQHRLSYCPDSRLFHWLGSEPWKRGVATTTSVHSIDPFSVACINVNLITEEGTKPIQPSPVVVRVGSQQEPLLAGGPGLIHPNKLGQAFIEIRNCGPEPIFLERDQQVGNLENAQDCDVSVLKSDVINAISQQQQHKNVWIPVSKEKEKFILDNLNLNVPPQYRDQYVELIKRHHSVFSDSKSDLGRSDTILHEIHLKTAEPVYVKQFKIPDTHR